MCVNKSSTSHSLLHFGGDATIREEQFAGSVPSFIPNLGRPLAVTHIIGFVHALRGAALLQRLEVLLGCIPRRVCHVVLRSFSLLRALHSNRYVNIGRRFDGAFAHTEQGAMNEGLGRRSSFSLITLHCLRVVLPSDYRPSRSILLSPVTRSILNEARLRCSWCWFAIAKRFVPLRSSSPPRSPVASSCIGSFKPSIDHGLFPPRHGIRKTRLLAAVVFVASKTPVSVGRTQGPDGH